MGTLKRAFLDKAAVIQRLYILIHRYTKVIQGYTEHVLTSEQVFIEVAFV